MEIMTWVNTKYYNVFKIENCFKLGTLPGYVLMVKRSRTLCLHSLTGRIVRDFLRYCQYVKLIQSLIEVSFIGA